MFDGKGTSIAGASPRGQRGLTPARGVMNRQGTHGVIIQQPGCPAEEGHRMHEKNRIGAPRFFHRGTEIEKPEGRRQENGAAQAAGDGGLSRSVRACEQALAAGVDPPRSRNPRKEERIGDLGGQRQHGQGIQRGQRGETSPATRDRGRRPSVQRRDAIAPPEIPTNRHPPPAAEAEPARRAAPGRYPGRPGGESAGCRAPGDHQARSWPDRTLHLRPSPPSGVIS